MRHLNATQSLIQHLKPQITEQVTHPAVENLSSCADDSRTGESQIHHSNTPYSAKITNRKGRVGHENWDHFVKVTGNHLTS